MKKIPLLLAVSSAIFVSSHVQAENKWTDMVEVGGVIEVEAQHVSPDGGADSSDIYVATAELGIGAKINENVSGEIVLKTVATPAAKPPPPTGKNT